MTEFEAERERLATLMDFELELDAIASEGKTEFTLEEVQKIIHEYARKIKIHK